MGLHGCHNGSYRLSSNGRQRGDGVRRSGGKVMLKSLGELFGRGELWIRIGEDGGKRLRGNLGHSPGEGIGLSRTGSQLCFSKPCVSVKRLDIGIVRIDISIANDAVIMS
jgi:hypothetical protein